MLLTVVFLVVYFNLNWCYLPLMLIKFTRSNFLNAAPVSLRSCGSYAKNLSYGTLELILSLNYGR